MGGLVGTDSKKDNSKRSLRDLLSHPLHSVQKKVFRCSLDHRQSTAIGLSVHNRVSGNLDRVPEVLDRDPPIVFNLGGPDAHIGAGNPLDGRQRRENRAHTVLAGHPLDTNARDHARKIVTA